MEPGKKIFEQHHENKEWINKLQFYKDETLILEQLLAGFALDHMTNKEIIAGVEHFQNQFIIQKNNLDEIKHLVNLNEQKLIALISANEIASDHRNTLDHTNERESVSNFEISFNKLRSEFNLFRAKFSTH